MNVSLLEKQLEGFVMTKILKKSDPICPGTPALQSRTQEHPHMAVESREIKGDGAAHAQSTTFFEFLNFPRLCPRKIKSPDLWLDFWGLIDTRLEFPLCKIKLVIIPLGSLFIKMTRCHSLCLLSKYVYFKGPLLLSKMFQFG